MDRSGRPLAAEVVERYLAPDPRRLGGGIALPFAIAMAEYDLPPMELALEVAAGNVDLGLEAELLAEPDRRAGAVANATRLAHTALERIDANRTARRELLAVLGDGPRPWLGSVLVAPAIVDALDEAAAAIEAGASLLRVDVPPSRELAEHMARVGGEPGPVARRAVVARGPATPGTPRASPSPPGPSGRSPCCAGPWTRPRARRRGYVRLVTEAPALAAPDQAVVAAFERIDGVIADPIREIVARARRPGPCPGRPRVRAPGPGARRDADPGAGRSAARRAGLRDRRPVGSGDPVRAGPRPPAARRRARPARRARGRLHLRERPARLDGRRAARAGPGRRRDRAPARHLLPEHALAFIEPALAPDAAVTWHAIVSALLPDAGEVDVILRRAAGPGVPSLGMTRRAANVAAALRRSRVPPVISGVAADHARRAVEAADATLASLEEHGWRAIVDQPLGDGRRTRGWAAVAERTEAFDPLAAGEPAG